jgi:hypothetical protein
MPRYYVAQMTGILDAVLAGKRRGYTSYLQAQTAT